MRALAVIVALALVNSQSPAAKAQSQPTPQTRHGRLFPPIDLGLLERPDRALWQKPDQIMDAVNVADGSTVADIGAGAGWFTIRLAQRVGPKGLVYAQDVQRLMLDAIKRRVQREGLENVRDETGARQRSESPGQGTRRDPDGRCLSGGSRESRRLPSQPARALKPNGRIGIVNWKPGRGGPGPEQLNERVERSVVEADAAAAGLRVLASENLRYQYLLVLAP